MQIRSSVPTILRIHPVAIRRGLLLRIFFAAGFVLGLLLDLLPELLDGVEGIFIDLPLYFENQLIISRITKKGTRKIILPKMLIKWHETRMNDDK
jgi:hypothetical protein